MRNVTHLNELIRLLNWGYKDNKETVSIPYSKFFADILEKLVLAGTIKSFQVHSNIIHILLGINLSGRRGRFVFRSLSFPSAQLFYSLNKLITIQRKRPDAVIFLYTSEGILTNSQAIEKRVGGKVLFEIL